VDLLVSVPTRAARALIVRAAPFVASQQVPSGAFDPTENEAVALIGLRALLAARAAR